MNTLEQICAEKRDHVRRKKAELPWNELEKKLRDVTPTRGFSDAIRKKAAARRPALIAEIKKASPSGGLIRPDFNPSALARSYEKAGAACLSVLTDEKWFQGENSDLAAARNACGLPAIRKDFMVDPYQIIESRVLGADCVLLIMAALNDAQALELYTTADNCGLDVLVEVHDREELDRALLLGARMIGVNSRNLKTLEVDLDIAMSLAAAIPVGTVAVAESGIKTHDDLVRLASAGYGAFLVGESLMRQDNLEAAVRALLGT